MNERSHLLTARIREQIDDICALPTDRVSDDVKIGALIEIREYCWKHAEDLLPETDDPVDRSNG